MSGSSPDTPPSEKGPAAKSGSFAVIKISNYRLTWPALMSTQMGRMMWMFVSTYLIFKLTDSALQAQIMVVCFSAPQFILGVFTGTLADAYDRRKVMMISIFLMSIVTYVAGVLAITGTIEPWHILVLSLLSGILFTVAQVARRTLTYDVVGTNLLMHAMALDNMASTVGFILAPLLASLFLTLAPGDVVKGTAYTYLAIATFYAVSCALLLFVKVTWTQKKMALRFGSAITSMAEGMRAAGKSRILLGILGITVISNLIFSPHRGLVPVIGDAVLHLSPAMLGLLGAAHGMGAISGSIFLSSRKKVRRQSTYYWGGVASSLAFLALFGLARNFPLAFIGLFFSGIGQAWFGAMQATMVLQASPEGMRGRIMGILNMAIGAQTIGSLAVGIMSESLGPGMALFWLALIGFFSTLMWTYAFKEMRAI